MSYCFFDLILIILHVFLIDLFSCFICSSVLMLSFYSILCPYFISILFITHFSAVHIPICFFKEWFIDLCSLPVNGRWNCSFEASVLISIYKQIHIFPCKDHNSWWERKVYSTNNFKIILNYMHSHKIHFAW